MTVHVQGIISASEIKTQYESNANTNEYDDTEQTKLSGCDTGSKDDQTGAEIKTAYEGVADTNAFTDLIKQNVSMRAWHSSGVGDLNTAVEYHAGYGEENYAMSCGGDNTVGDSTTEVEEFNGTVWSTAGAGDLNTGVDQHAAGGGSASSGLIFGGYHGVAVTAETEKWNGSTWSVAGIGDLNTAVGKNVGCNGAGSTSQYYSWGGKVGNDPVVETEKYLIGDTWSVAGIGDLNTGVMNHSGCHNDWGSAGGTFTISFGGRITASWTPTIETEATGGATWSVNGIGDMLFPMYYSGCAGTGSGSISFGGSSSYTYPMQEYRRFATDMGYWFDSNAFLNTNASSNVGSGHIDDALSFGGYSGAKTAETEEYI